MLAKLMKNDYKYCSLNAGALHPRRVEKFHYKLNHYKLSYNLSNNFMSNQPKQPCEDKIDNVE